MRPPRTGCFSAACVSAKLLLSFLVLSPVVTAEPRPPAYPQHAPGLSPGDLGPGPVLGGGPAGSREGAAHGEHEFSLRHILHHGSDRYPGMMRRLDIHPNTLVATEENPVPRPRPQYVASSRIHPIQRLVDRSRDTMEAHLYSYRHDLATSFSAEAFTTDEISQPNMTDKETVMTLAKMAADAYVEVEGTLDWLDVGNVYNLTDDFGWDGDGLRGHIFADEKNSTVIISVKGTSMAVFDGAGTTTNDKINDNMFFSCCCARVSYWWSTVCDCFSDTAYTCNNTCLSKAIRGENLYYRASLQLYYNVTQMYPDADIWVVGHSLGGAVASLLGQTYGLPVVAFEAPAEALASIRLGLPTYPGKTKPNPDLAVYHVGHTADPLFMGTCNGPTSACSIGGYAMETHCHAGVTCVYDVVSDKGWRMGLGYHRIQSVIKDVIATYDDVPECTFEPDCIDCFNWNFITGNETTTTTTTTTSTASTSTTTCETPGWWGCRDITTTTTTITTIPTATGPVTVPRPTGSTTCTSYGWFGNCLDPSPAPTAVGPTKTFSSSHRLYSTSRATPTETCAHYGWFGHCRDDDPAPATSCHDPGMFWGCWDPTPTVTFYTTTTLPLAATNAHTVSAPAETDPVDRGHWKCVNRALGGLGWCEEWRWQADWEGAEL